MRNRIMAYGESGEIQPIRLPKPAAPAVTSTGFMMIPSGLLPPLSQEQWCWQQWVHQQAFERAQAEVTPSLIERDLAGYWN
jgi:hypothetical protein